MRITNILAVIGAALLMAMAYLFGSGQFPLPPASQSNPSTNFTSAAVVQRIQRLNQLTTTKYTMQLVVGKGQDGNWIGYGKDKLLLIAQGNVVAGLDLSQMTARDVTIDADRTTIMVNLPPAKVMDNYLQENHTQVYERETNIFTSADPQLETAARRQASEEILKAACEAGILKEAADDSQKAVEQLLLVLGFKDVTVTSTASGACVAPAS
jgi:hypothetical protein